MKRSHIALVTSLKKRYVLRHSRTMTENLRRLSRPCRCSVIMVGYLEKGGRRELSPSSSGTPRLDRANALNDPVAPSSRRQSASRIFARQGSFHRLGHSSVTS